jgi:hypothetical protein
MVTGGPLDHPKGDHDDNNDDDDDDDNWAD